MFTVADVLLILASIAACALTVVIIALFMIKRLLLLLLTGINDRHIEIRTDKKTARDARAAESREVRNSIMAASEELRSICLVLASISTTYRKAQHRPEPTLTENSPSAGGRGGSPSQGVPPSVRGVRLRANDAPKGIESEPANDLQRPSEELTVIMQRPAQCSMPDEGGSPAEIPPCERAVTRKD